MMDETIDEFKENFKLIKEKNKQLKLATISKFLSPVTSSQTNDSASTSSKISSSSSSKLSFNKLNETIEIKKNSSLSKKNSKKDDKISKYFINNSQTCVHQNDDYKCPICSNDLKNLSESNRDKHVNECLDNKDYSNFKYKSTNKFVRNQSTEESSIQTEQLQVSSSTVNVNIQSNQMTKEELENKQKKLNESLLKDAVPNCPICGKVLHNFNIRQNHLKKCSQVFHIKTESLVELVKKQQEKIERDLAKGIIPTDVYFIKQKVDDKTKNKKNKITNRVIKLEQPINKQEEQLQIAIALSNSINPADDCPKQVEIKLFKGNNKKLNSIESVLLLTDDETRNSIISKRFALILENHINYQQVNEQIVDNCFVKTRFKSDNNYLWNKCKYFQETEENFYVQAFLQSGKLSVGQQVFIEKTDQEKFSDIQVINTQTAFLLADLNDQTQENLSIYYTQQTRLNQSQFNQTQFQLNQSNQAHLTLDSIREDQDTEEHFHTQIQQTLLIEKEKELNNINQVASNIEAYESESKQELDQEEMSKENQVNIIKPTICLFETDSSNDIQICDQEEVEDSMNSLTSINCDDFNKRAVFIDETKLSISTNEDSKSEEIQQEIPSNHNSSSNSNILDQNIIDDTNLTDDEIESNQVENKPHNINEETIEIIDEDNIILNQTKKRKSIDIIELDDEEKQDCLEVCFENEQNENVQKFKKQKFESLNNSSSSSLPSLSDKKDILDKSVESNKSDEQDKDILLMLEKTQKIHDDNENLNIENNDLDPLDEVWKNFGESQFEIYQETNLINSIDEPQVDNTKENHIQAIILNEPEMNQAEEDDDIDEFIRNYRCERNLVNNEPKPEETKKRTLSPSPNSTLNDEDLDDLKQLETKSPKKNSISNNNKKPKITKESDTALSTKINQEIPNFTSMDTPNLKCELKKFGLKQLPKKQAIRKLVEIYEYTSRKNTKQTSSFQRSQSCMNFKTTVQSSSLKSSSSTMNLNKPSQIEQLEDEEDDIETMAKIMNLESNLNNKKQTKKNTIKKTVSDLNIILNRDENFTQPKSTGLLKINSLEMSQKFKKTNKKNNKNLHECTLDDKILELVELDDDDEEDRSESSESGMINTQKQKSGKLLNKVNKMLDETETRQAVYNILKADENLYLNVLNYEPLDYDKFFNELQVSLAPRKANTKLLMKVLDEFCVTFTLKNLNTRGASSAKLKSRKKH